MLTFDDIEDCFPEGAASEPDGRIGVSAQWLHDFARAVAAKEREACAQVCLEVAEDGAGMAGEVWAERCCTAIRKRSNDQLERGRAQEHEETKGGVSASARSDS